MSEFGTPSTGERWNVNLPAVIGVVFAFLIGVIVWVVVSGGSDEPAAEPSASVVQATTTTVRVTDVAITTTPAPMPDLANTTVAETATTTVPTVTTAAGAVDGAVPGDLAIPGRPMQQPSCDGGYITIVASAVGAQATAPGIARVLEAHPDSEYLRTDQTCPSLRADVDGQPIYVVYFGPYALDSDACAARSLGAAGSYVKRLSTDLGPGHGVSCP